MDEATILLLALIEQREVMEQVKHVRSKVLCALDSLPPPPVALCSCCNMRQELRLQA